MTGALEPPQLSGMALCAQVDPELWFPEKGGNPRQAKQLCQQCEVRDECLQYALNRDERFGIWGGLSERERRRLKKRPPAAAAPVLEHVEPRPAPTAPTAEPRRLRPWRDDELAAAVQQLRRYGMTYAEMAAELQTSISRVRSATKRRGDAA